jgi:hypothetical protein
MSDVQNALPIPEASAAAISKMPADTASVARAALQAAGYRVDGLAQGVIGKPAVVVTPEAPAAPKVDAVNTQRWLDLYKNFSGDKAQVVAAALKSNVDILALQADAQVAPIIAAQKQQQALAAALEPPAAATDYRIDYGAHAQGMENIEAFNTMLTKGFLEVGVPQSSASGLAQAFLESAKMYESKLDPRYNDADDLAREQVHLKGLMLAEGSKVRALSNSAETVRLAELAEKSLPKAMRDQLYASQSFHTANAQGQLAALGRILEQRKAKP